MPVLLAFKVDQAAVTAIGLDPNGPVRADLRRRGNLVLNAARRGTPVDQGTLRASEHTEEFIDARGPGVRIGSDLEYAIYVHEGTGVYAGRGPITPKRGQYLRWPFKNNSGQGARRYSGGKTAAFVYARSVRGVKGRPFLTDALPAAAG